MKAINNQVTKIIWVCSSIPSSALEHYLSRRTRCRCRRSSSFRRQGCGAGFRRGHFIGGSEMNSGRQQRGIKGRCRKTYFTIMEINRCTRSCSWHWWECVDKFLIKERGRQRADRRDWFRRRRTNRLGRGWKKRGRRCLRGTNPKAWNNWR